MLEDFLKDFEDDENSEADSKFNIKSHSLSECRTPSEDGILHALPSELIVRCFLYLQSYQDWIHLSLTCKAFLILSENVTPWDISMKHETVLLKRSSYNNEQMGKFVFPEVNSTTAYKIIHSSNELVLHLSQHREKYPQNALGDPIESMIGSPIGNKDLFQESILSRVGSLSTKQKPFESFPAHKWK